MNLIRAKTLSLFRLLLFSFCGELEGALFNMINGGKGVCLTPRCVIQSAAILESIDPAADPCQDFYAYACGKWGERQRIPPRAQSWGNFNMLYEENLRILIEELERDGCKIGGVRSEAVEKAKKFFRSCLDEKAIRDASSQPLLQLIRELGGWELIDNLGGGSYHGKDGDDVDTNVSIPQLIASIHKKAAFPLFSMAVSPDDKNSSRNIISFQQSGLGMVLENYYLNNNQTEEDAYIKFGTEVVSLLRQDQIDNEPDDEVPSAVGLEGFFLDFITDDDQLELLEIIEQFIEITSFEVQLATAYIPENETRDPESLYHRMALAEFTSSIPQFDISEYLKAMFNEDIPLDEDVVVYTPSYFKKLNDVLAADGVTERLLRSYTMWYLVQDLVFYMTTPYRLAAIDFLESLEGYTTLTASLGPDQCAVLTANAMGMVAGALFVERHSSPETITRMESMIDDIRDEFIHSISSLDWMDENTQDAAREKAVVMGNKIAYPPWILRAEEVDKRYHDISMASDDLLDNVIVVRRFEIQHMLSRRGKQVNKATWFMNPIDVNAYYEPSLNEVVFPAGILQPPFYDSSLPRSIQYGAIGWVIGHELIHAFDAFGRHYDDTGDLHDWWDNEAEAAYQERTRCLVEQYENFTVGNRHIDGEKTLNENVADNEGIRLALGAFQKWLREHPDEETVLPGLHNMTSIQTFFLGAAQIWCDVLSPAAARLKILLDEHSPDPVRVRGPLSNMEQFSGAFACPPGSAMNPLKKCRVW